MRNLFGVSQDALLLGVFGVLLVVVAARLALSARREPRRYPDVS